MKLSGNLQLVNNESQLRKIPHREYMLYLRMKSGQLRKRVRLVLQKYPQIRKKLLVKPEKWGSRITRTLLYTEKMAL